MAAHSSDDRAWSSKIEKQQPKIPFSLSPWPYFLAYTIFPVLYCSIQFQLPFLLLAYIFVFMPLLDLFCGIDNVNPSKAMERQLREDIRYRWIVILWVPLHICALVYSLHTVCARGQFSSSSSIKDFVTFALSIGSMGGLSINVAHELIHKVGFLEPFCGRLLLSTLCFEHFAIEHVKGHHKRVSTPEDPASAPLNMMSWPFVARSMVGSLRSAWHLDAGDVAMGFVHTTCVFSSMLALLVPKSNWGEGLCFLLIQSIMAIVMLELINYVEHYGLERARLPHGEYEQVTQFHSWNAAHRFTNYFLFKLQRHSDHHAIGGKRYQLLRTYSASPHLPYGYGGMIVLAAFRPWYYRKLMNPLAIESMRRKREYEEKGINPFLVDNMN